MKTSKTILMLLLTGTIFLGSCKKDEETTNTNTNTTTVTESMTAKIDGANWTGASFYSLNFYGTFLFEGIASDGSEIALTMPSDATVGAHDITSMYSSYQIMYYKSSSAYEYTENGFITITSITSDVVKGTFEGETSLGNITSGAFTAKL